MSFAKYHKRPDWGKQQEIEPYHKIHTVALNKPQKNQWITNLSVHNELSKQIKSCFGICFLLLVSDGNFPAV